MVWPCQKDARGQNTKINYGMDTTRERRKSGRARNAWIGVQADRSTRNIKPGQWRERNGVWFQEDGDNCSKKEYGDSCYKTT